MNIYSSCLLSAAMLCMSACSYTNHFTDDDGLEPSAPYNVMSELDATAYDSWVYVNLETGETEVHPDTGEWYYSGTGETTAARPDVEVGIDWHIAVHRYEFMTNKAAALNTGITDMETVTTLPDGEYTPDETVNYHDQLDIADGTQYLIVTDMSRMIDGSIGYALNGRINRVLCDAVTRTDTGSMPPTLYGSTGEVVALRFADNSGAAIKITKTYGGNNGTRSGVISFQYKFYKAQ